MDRLSHNPLERPPRVYRHEWSAKPWRGSFGEILKAIEAAHEEITRDASDETCSTYITVHFADNSSESFNSLSVFEIGLQTIDPAEVTRLYVRLSASISTAVVISGGLGGLSVSAEGTKDLVAGVGAGVMPRLSAGREAAGGIWRHRSWAERAAASLYAALLAAVFVGTLVASGNWVRAFALSVAVGGFLVAALFLTAASHRQGRPLIFRRPSFLLVAEASGPLDAGQEGPSESRRSDDAVSSP